MSVQAATPGETRRDSIVPDVYVIGAMRSGTTTFCADLSAHPGIYFPPAKEPWVLVQHPTLDAAKERYRHLYGSAGRRGRVLVDGSTSYAMRPQHPSVADLASRLSPGARVVYLVRNPVRRAISHHQHLLAWRATEELDLEQLLVQDETLTAFGRYRWQIEPWLEAFGPEAVDIILFEEYVRDRQRIAREFVSSLGLEPQHLTVHDEAVFNQSAEARVVPPVWRSVFSNDLYWRARRLIPPSLRARVRDRLLPAAPVPPGPPSRAAVEQIIEACREDATALAELLGRREPLWDWEATLRDFS